MINYQIAKSDLPIYAKQVGFAVCKMPLILGCISTPFMLYGMIIGIFFDREILMYFGYPLLLFTVVSMIASVNIYRSYKRVVIYMFSDDMCECSLNREFDTFIYENLTLKTQFYFYKNDIKSIIYYKGVIVVQFRSNTKFSANFMFFPNTEEIRGLFRY